MSEAEVWFLGAGVAHSPRFGLGTVQRMNMKTTKLIVILLTVFAIGTMVGCYRFTAKSPDLSDSIRRALNQAGLKDVSVSQDRDKGIVTLGGQVASADKKAQAEYRAKSFAGAQVVAVQFVVIRVGAEKEARAVYSDLDQGIEKNLDAALIQNKMQHDVKYSVKSGVVTLTGEVNSQDTRTFAEKVATGVPNVQQVVNNLQVNNQKATSGQ
jgi:hyperosmotically inducible protein